MTSDSISAPDTSEPRAAVRSYIDAFNRGNLETMSQLCADPMSILDGMAPHVWHHRPSATADSYRDVGEHLDAAGYNVESGEAKHNAVADDAAHVVFPTTMHFTVQGKPIIQTSAFFNVALRKVGGEWRLASWAWIKGTAHVVT